MCILSHKNTFVQKFNHKHSFSTIFILKGLSGRGKIQCEVHTSNNKCEFFRKGVARFYCSRKNVGFMGNQAKSYSCTEIELT